MTYKYELLEIEPSKWIITREPTRLITSSGRVGLKKLQILERVKYKPNPLRTNIYIYIYIYIYI